MVLPDSSPIPTSLAPAGARLRPRALPSTGVTRLPRYYGPLRHPIQATPSLTRPWLSEHATHPPNDGVSRVASISPVHACHRHYPGGTTGCLCRSTSPTTAAFPEFPTGRLPHQSFRGLLSVHCSLWPACSPSPIWTLYTGSFGRFVTSTTAPIATGWSDRCRVGISPTERTRLFTAH